MTDKARELLERAYYVLGELSYAILKDSGEYNLAGDIYEFLAEPTQDSVIADYATSEPVGGSKMELTTEPTQDEAPVGTLDHNGNFKLLRMVGIPISQPMKLYEHPAPRPEFVRLSEEEIMDLSRSESESFRWPSSAISIARAIEDALEEKNRG